MKSINMEISLDGLNLSPEDKNLSACEIFGKMIDGIIMSYSQMKQGLTDKERRQYYKILDVIGDVLKNNDTEMNLEDSEFGFLKTCKQDTKMMPNKLLRRVEDKIEAVKQR